MAYVRKPENENFQPTENIVVNKTTKRVIIRETDRMDYNGYHTLYDTVTRQPIRFRLGYPVELPLYLIERLRTRVRTPRKAFNEAASQEALKRGGVVDASPYTKTPIPRFYIEYV